MRRPASGSGRDAPESAQVFRQIKGQVADFAEQITGGARSTGEQLKKQVSDVANAIMETVQEEAERLFEKQRDKAASKVASIGKVIGQAGHALHAVRMGPVAEYIDAAAEQADQASSYIKERDLSEVMQDAEELISRHRGLVIGGLFVAGFACARFLKASGPSDASAGEDDQTDDGESDGDGEDVRKSRPSRPRSRRRRK